MDVRRLHVGEKRLYVCVCVREIKELQAWWPLLLKKSVFMAEESRKRMGTGGHAMFLCVLWTLEEWNWNENISFHINKQEISQPSVISGLQIWIRVPKTVIQQMLPPPMVIAVELGGCEKPPSATP